MAQNAGQCLSGAEGGGSSYTPDLSDHGRYVTFATEADNLVVDPARACPGSPSAATAAVRHRRRRSHRAANGGGPQHVNQPPGPVRVPPRSIRLSASSTGGPRSRHLRRWSVHHLHDRRRVLPRVRERATDDGVRRAGRQQPLRHVTPRVAARRRHLAARGLPDTPLGSPGGPAHGPVHPGLRTGADPELDDHRGERRRLRAGQSAELPAGRAPAAAHLRRVAPAGPRSHRAESNCSVFVAFTPTASGPRSAVLQVVAGVNPFSVPGTQPQVFNIPLTGTGGERARAASRRSPRSTSARRSSRRRAPRAR